MKANLQPTVYLMCIKKYLCALGTSSIWDLITSVCRTDDLCSRTRYDSGDNIPTRFIHTEESFQAMLYTQKAQTDQIIQLPLHQSTVNHY